MLHETEQIRLWASTAMMTMRCWQKYKYDFAKILAATLIKYMQ